MINASPFLNYLVRRLVATKKGQSNERNTTGLDGRREERGQ